MIFINSIIFTGLVINEFARRLQAVEISDSASQVVKTVTGMLLNRGSF